MTEDKNRPKDPRRALDRIHDQITSPENNPFLKPGDEECYTNSSLNISDNDLTFDDLIDVKEQMHEMNQKRARKVCDLMDFPYDEHGIYIIDWGPGEGTESFRGPVEFVLRLEQVLIGSVYDMGQSGGGEYIEDVSMEGGLKTLSEDMSMYYVKTGERIMQESVMNEVKMEP